MSRPAGSLPRAALGQALLLALLGALALWLLALHVRGMAWHDPGRVRWAWAAAVLLAWLVFVGVTWRTRRRAARADRAALAGADAGARDAVVVAYASQTGFAEQLARRTVQSLQAAGVPVRGAALGELDAAALAALPRVLFVASTTGEGDAPDGAAGFARRCLSAPAALGGLRYGLLALGDRDYADFCGFGRRLHDWLQRSGAQALFDPVEVDNGDAGALRHWQHHLALLSGASELPDWRRPDYRRWRLVERRQLNPGTLGGAAFHLALQPLDGELAWQAGDIAEVGPRHDGASVTAWLAAAGADGGAVVDDGERRVPLAELLARSHLPPPEEARGLDAAALAARLQPLPHREYSIASVPADGALHLLVRRMRRADGTPGLGSGWLTAGAPPGAEIALRIRANPNFRPPANDVPLILIGNGTGMAGLRALLRARIAAGAARHWLLFGERQAAHDFYYHEEIEAWRRAGRIERLDLAWSRDGGARVYVQHLLARAADELRRWIDAGAAIRVCGSLDGMAPGVDAALREALGAEAVERLRAQGRYRRDVY